MSRKSERARFRAADRWKASHCLLRGGRADAFSASRSTLFGYIFGSASYGGGRETSQVLGVNDTDAYTFYIPASLRSVKITGGEIFYGTFSDCTLLTELIVPETIKTVADYAFYYCSNLKQFTIPVTVESIGDHAFYYCYGLKSITIPDRVTSIRDYAINSERDFRKTQQKISNNIENSLQMIA